MSKARILNNEKSLTEGKFTLMGKSNDLTALFALQRFAKSYYHIDLIITQKKEKDNGTN